MNHNEKHRPDRVANDVEARGHRAPFAPEDTASTLSGRKAPARTHWLRRVVATLAALIGLTMSASVLTAIGLASPASAYTHTSSGTPGGVTPYQIVGTHFQVACGGYACFQPGLTVHGPLVSRSRATSGAQIVVLSTVVYRWDNTFGWVKQIQDNQSRTIPAGVQTARFGNRNWLPNTGGAKYVVFALAWADQSGRSLGTRGIAMNQGGDYVCQTRYTWACTAYNGFVTITQP